MTYVTHGARRLAVAVWTVPLVVACLAGTASGAPGHRSGVPANRPSWKIRSVSAASLVTGKKWHDCVQITPTPGFQKSYPCNISTSVGNSYSQTVGVTSGEISTSVGYSVTYTFTVAAGVTWTPEQADEQGEVQWANQYWHRYLHEQQWDGFTPGGWVKGYHRGNADRFAQATQRFVPAGVYLSSDDYGTFTNRWWKVTGVTHK